MIVFYISSHGFGHLTRSLVHIKRYLKETEQNIYVVCGEKQIEFAKKYLKKFLSRLKFKEMMTDVGLINKENSLEIDKLKLEEELFRFIQSWEALIEREVEFLRNENIEKIITDISPIGMLVGQKLEKKVEAISNFTWYNQYKFLNLNKWILDRFLQAERLIDEFYVYPLALDLSHITCTKKDIDYVSRDFNYDKIKSLRASYGKSIFISCGKSANLGSIEIKNFQGTIFYTEGIDVYGEGYHVKLPVETSDTHNYLGASDFAIIKAGWGTVAEAILSKVPMVLLEREGVLEDSYTINELKKQNKAISIKVEELKVLDIEILEQKIRTLTTNNTKKAE